MEHVAKQMEQLRTDITALRNSFKGSKGFLRRALIAKNLPDSWLDAWEVKLDRVFATVSAGVPDADKRGDLGMKSAYNLDDEPEATETRRVSICDTQLKFPAAPRRDQGICPYCHGNDGAIPCAYPSEGKPGCLRDARVRLVVEFPKR
jgi:hypothetical protein